MGYPKWRLPFNTAQQNTAQQQQTLLARLVSIIRPEVSKIVVSISDQPKNLFAELEVEQIVADVKPNCGPLEGIRTALKFLADDYESAFVTACDVPFFPNNVISKLHNLLTADYEAVIPVLETDERKRVFGMTAIYRCSANKKIDALTEAGRLKVSALAEELNTRVVAMPEMRSLDPKLDSLSNINTPDEYFEALAALGLSGTDEVSKILKARQAESAGE